MERLCMQLIQDIIYRLRQGQSERAVARDLGHSRVTVHRYRELAREKGYLDRETPLPDAVQLLAELGPPPPPPVQVSTVEPYRALVEEWVAQGVEMRAMHRHLVERHGYTGSYGSVCRFVKHLSPIPAGSTAGIRSDLGETLGEDAA